MKTPITDAAVESDDSLVYEGGVWILPFITRRLELDRAALLDALLESTTELEALMKDKSFYQGGQNILDRARAAIAKATGEDAR